MPSKSKKQAKLMRAVAHGWKPDRIKGPTRAVAKEFMNADERRDKVTGYQFGGGVSPGMYGNMMSRMPYRGVPPQRASVQRGPMGGRAGALQQYMQRMRGAGGPRGGMRPGMNYPGGSATFNERTGRREGLADRVRGATDQYRRAQSVGKPGRGTIPLGGGKQLPGRRIAPPPGKYPGGGNPNLRGRNPMMRQSRSRFSRGPTSFLR